MAHRPLLAAALAIAPLAAAAAGDPLTAAITARALHPGEVVRLDLRTAVPVASVRATAFGRDVALYATDPGAWRGLVGIDLDVSPGAHAIRIEARTPAGGALATDVPLVVEPKRFPTRTLKVDPKFVSPPAAVQSRIRRERERLAGLFAVVGADPAWSGPFVPPIPGAMNSGFGVRSVYNGEPRSPHSGADFRSPAGTPVRAPGAGVVTLAEDLYYTGLTVVIDHGVGLHSLFAHLSRLDVERGRTVERGTIVGAVGATGRVTGPHLHWTVRLNGARVDPLSLIAALEGTGG